MKEVIGKIAKPIFCYLTCGKSECDKYCYAWEKVKTYKDTWHFRVAEAILNLCCDCKECGGSGKYSESQRGSDGFEQCPTCQGTGKGERLLYTREELKTAGYVKLAENQEVPECQTPLGVYDDGWHQKGFKDAIELMTTPKDGVVWRKTKA